MQGILGLAIQILYFLFLARVIISWVAPHSRHPAVQLVRNMTEPILAPIRNLIPPQGGLDLSILVVFVALSVISRMI